MRPFEPDGSVHRDAVQRSRVLRYVALAVLLLGPLVLAGCEEQTTGMPITGMDHLPDHLSVSQFYVDGYSAFQAGGGGSTVCCASLPSRWRPDLTVEIRWHITNWRDCDWVQHTRRVRVERYDEPGRLWVHFMKDGKVRAISSGIGPGNPSYPGPQDSIPSKEPWDDYPWDDRCNARFKGDAPRVVRNSEGSGS
jgi:hypothetical protein